MVFNYEFKDNTNDTEKIMVVEDPIYREIEIPYPFYKLILAKEMQRLSGITQNGFSIYEYPSLKDNDRLHHSIGAFHIMSQIISHIEKSDISISSEEKNIALCSMLLHDIGHGPYSHTWERLTNYSHEKRTKEILENQDTEIHKILVSLFGEQKINDVISFITNIDDKGENITATASSFTNLLKTLISHQLDADRLDYLQRDAHYANINSNIYIESLLSALQVSVHSDGSYFILIDKKYLRNIESVIIQRLQNYRDIYLTDKALVSEKIFVEIINTLRKINYSNLNLSEGLKKLIEDSSDIPLDVFLKLSDAQFTNDIEIIKKASTSNHLLNYLANIQQALNDYKKITNNDVTRETIIKKIQEIIPNYDLSNTSSIVEIKAQTNSYNPNESLRINFGYTYKDLAESSDLIQPNQYFTTNGLFFNSEVLRLELGLTIEDFKQYKEKLDEMISTLNKKPIEFELKYIADDRQKEDILSILKKNGFEIIKEDNKVNNDFYYDTIDLSLYKEGCSLRIRETTQDGEKKYRATYKKPVDNGDVYSSREEIDFETNNIEELKKEMKKRGIPIEYDKLVRFPILNVCSNRKDYTLQINGSETVVLSFDKSTYTNLVLEARDSVRAMSVDFMMPNSNNFSVTESMIEIEAQGDINNRIILQKINNLLKPLPLLTQVTTSKYTNGIQKTYKTSKERDGKDRDIRDI